MSVVLVATIKPLPDRVDDVVAAFAKVIPSVHAEPGCELYALHRSADSVVMIEKWESPEALKTHSGSAGLAELNHLLKGLVAGAPDLVRLEAVPVGTEAQGAL